MIFTTIFIVVFWIWYRRESEKRRKGLWLTQEKWRSVRFSLLTSSSISFSYFLAFIYDSKKDIELIGGARPSQIFFVAAIILFLCDFLIRKMKSL